MKQLGLRAHDLGSFSSIKDLAKEVAKYGKNIPIQLALKKVVKDAPDAFAYTEAFIESVRDDLAAEGAYVGVFGSYINPVHPDEGQRDVHLKRFEQHLKYAKLLGCRLVGTETGSPNADCSYHLETASQKNLDIFYKSVERLVEAAVKYDAVVGIEAVSKQHTMSSVERMAKLVETFKTEHLAVIYDPVNLVPWIGIPESDGSYPGQPSLDAQKAYIRAALDAFGSRIAAIHVKDYRLNEQGFKIGDITVGTGVMDWAYIATEFRSRNIEVPALLENLCVSTLARDLETLRSN